MSTTTPSSSGTSTTTSSSSASILKRGGTHPIFGIYVGGSSLDKDYSLTNRNGYSGTSQLRSKKSLNLAENSLYTQRDDTTSLKFNGKMDVASNTVSLSELNLESFLRAVGDTAERFGLETFFYLPSSSSEMIYLPEDPHTFTLAAVLTEHKSRLVEPSPVLDLSSVETPASVVARFKAYDVYESCDIYISRLAIEALVHPELRAEIVVQYSHMK